MAKVTLVCWQEIPSAVEARDGRAASKVQLSQRFMELIDTSAMRKGLSASDAYLAHWRKEKRPDMEGDVAQVARAVADEIEARFEAIRDAAIKSADE